MDCVQTTWLTDEEYLRHFNRKIARQRVPLFGSFSLTHRCNLRCAHCYLDPAARRGAGAPRELGGGELARILDEAAEAGCLQVLLTGGEPMLHRDFARVYRRAKTNGLLVNVFTNATRITPNVLDLFCDLPPHAVEVSVYGATAETYERITGVEGSYGRCIAGIEALLDRGLCIKLKTVLMTLNQHEFFEIESMARGYGVGFRFDAAIFPRFDGDRGPISLRVPAGEAVEMEFADEGRRRACEKYYQAARNLPATDALYRCGAGRILFHVDPYGVMTPCLMTDDPRYDLCDGTFAQGWRDVLPRIMEKKAGRDFICSHCERKTLCDPCSAFFRLENGSEGCRSEYLCAMARHRSERLRNGRFERLEVEVQNAV
ncbi:MAG: radical SAM protein [Planctomycetota bacterium]